MQHSVNWVGERHEQVSDMRKDEKRFVKSDFVEFAKQNRQKYSIIENGDDFLVSTFYCGDLVKDYIKTLK